MTARITLTVDYNEIPKESNYIIERSLSRIETVVEYLKASTEEEDVSKKLSIIEKARQSLILADANLEDGYQILLGYAKNELEIKTPKGEEKKNE